MADTELDQAIKKFHEADKKRTEKMFKLYENNAKNNTPMAQDQENPKDSATELWFEGRAKWGKEWTEREYELREK